MQRSGVLRCIFSPGHTRALLFQIAQKLDYDTLQDMFESEMDKDGYFDEVA
jgi:hypothetical protein